MDRDEAYYDAHAPDVDFETIASSEDNRDILDMLRNDEFTGYSLNAADEITNEYVSSVLHYIVREDSLDWLGYFIGKCTTLEHLIVSFSSSSQRERAAFFRGVRRNRTIIALSIKAHLGDEDITDLRNYVRENSTLTQLQLSNVDIGVEHGTERARNVALALSESTSFRSLHFEDNNLEDDGFAAIAASLTKQTQLRHLKLIANSIGATSCNALVPMLRSNFLQLRQLDLSHNNIDDTGLERLVGGLCGSASLEDLNLSGNNLITGAGLRSFSYLFSSESCKLEHLTLEEMIIGDDEAEALAAVLVGNKTLRYLHFNMNTISSAGWSAFSRLLGDPSSINNTYLSNHTVELIGTHNIHYTKRRDVDRYLGWNICTSFQRDTPKPKIKKILYIHRDLDMEPFFQYKLKFLPLVVAWLQSSAAYFDHAHYGLHRDNPKIGCRQLAAIFKFIRSKPQLVADGYCAHLLKDTREKKRKLQLQLDALNETEKKFMKRARR